jgi:hypothetical protein
MSSRHGGASPSRLRRAACHRTLFAVGALERCRFRRLLARRTHARASDARGQASLGTRARRRARDRRCDAARWMLAFVAFARLREPLVVARADDSLSMRASLPDGICRKRAHAAARELFARTRARPVAIVLAGNRTGDSERPRIRLARRVLTSFARAIAERTRFSRGHGACDVRGRRQRSRRIVP